jgi:hypothetical protein
MLFGKRAHCRDLIVCTFNRACTSAAKQLRFHPDRKKLCVKISGLCAHCVKVAIAEFLLKIDVLVDQPLCGVGVHVHCDGALMDRHWVGIGF